jgi:outer membrane receptor for ferrienterochelin and colicins
MVSLLLAIMLGQSGLKPDAGVSGDEPSSRQTVVTGTRTERLKADSVVATEVITRAQLEQLGVRDAPQLLQQLPGADMVYTNRGIGLRLQGLDPEYVLILVDGQRLAGRAGAFVDLSRLSLRAVERVEIVKGPAAAVYGADAIGGVVNFITRRPQKSVEGSIRGMFGTLLEGDVRGHGAAQVGPFEVRVGGGYRTRDPYDWNPSDAALTGAGIRRVDGDAEFAWIPSEGARVWAQAGYVFTDLNAVDINETSAVFDRFQRTEQVDGRMGATLSLSPDTTLTATAHAGYFRDQFLVDQRGSRALDDYSRNFTRLYEGFVQIDERLGTHFLSGGLEGIGESLVGSRIEPPAVERQRLGIFIQDEWSFSSDAVRVAVAPGIRLDMDSQFGMAPAPRLALKIDPIPALTVRASWGLGFRPPTFSELYLQFANTGIGYTVKGNPKLRAERSGSLNLSLEYRPRLEGWTLSVAAWHSSLTDLINVSANGVPNPDDPVVFGYDNVSEAYTQGIELNARLRLSKGTYLDLGYMGLDARDVERSRALEGRSAHQVHASITTRYRPAGVELVVRSTWRSARPFYVGSGLGLANVLEGGGERTVYGAAYLDLEAQIAYSFRRWLKVFVNGYNLAQAGDEDFNPRPPRGVLGGVQLEY